ncbi:chemotaxis protein CheB [Mycobacterium sp. IDR2000157661]|uniref:chemotaxis protein CheB n=1 Tax=Mycobacterium sp. IDR2000157661 TaxID=2867005 RepID=UPI001EEC1418|nr:chemotaxis protein CheB [Mycobacterium sp. IDR2000157661]ULE31238.1 chemotaxis protein CheB [Mycobacterium sp. IDR2000157661]
MASGYNGDGGALRGVVAVGASAGGVEALTEFAAGLPAELPYAVVIVLHVPANAPSVLAQIIDRSGPLPAIPATDGAKLEPGYIHVAVPDRHLLVLDHHIMLSEGPTENRHRPAINAMFRSVALSAGPRAVGVLLSGVLDDGVLGMSAIRSRGGTTIAQRIDDALFPAMPRNAIEAGAADHQSTAGDVGALLATLADREIEERQMEPDPGMELENRIAMGSRFQTEFDAEALGPPSGYTCPDCNGSLMTLSKDNFRCRVGHAWTGDALLGARDSEVETALWVALRSLHEKAKLARRLAESSGPGAMSQRYHDLADQAERAITILGKRLTKAEPGAGHAAGE